jgi:hypothetical protein
MMAVMVVEGRCYKDDERKVKTALLEAFIPYARFTYMTRKKYYRHTNPPAFLQKK